MSASAAVVLFVIAGAISLAVALALVRARLRALESAFAGVRLDLAARDEALRAAERSRGQMLADVSHELRTPLTAMRGYLETLQMADLDLDAITRERYLRTIERETVRLDRIVEDLLDLARLENGVGAMDVRLFAIGKLFEHVVHRHEHEARMRQIAVSVSVADEADQVLADPDRLEQVVENLVANALRHTPSGGNVELCATADGAAVVLTVADSGEGIDPQHLAHVFERFYKGDAARTNNTNGSGLGLSIAKAIVERHHGSIHVESAAGRTAFTIVLPQGESRHG